MVGVTDRRGPWPAHHRRPVLGDETVLRLVRSTSTPVLAVGPEFAIPETIVVGIDISANSVHAAQLALRFVDHDSTIHLIHVVPDGLLGMVAGGPAEYHERAMAAMSRLVTRIIRRSPVAVLTLPE